MLSLFKGFRASAALVSGALAFFAACFIKTTPIIGSLCKSFSLLSALMPLTGILGLGAAALAAFLRSGMSLLTLSAPLIAPVYHIPGFCAAASWAYPTALMQVGLPFLCMILFVLHPCGFYAAPYALYWLIPMAIHVSGKKSIFLQALSATFVAHAVGSVVYLYLKALPTAVWLGLIPVVIFERLLNAALMTAVYYGIKECMKLGMKMDWSAQACHAVRGWFLQEHR